MTTTRSTPLVPKELLRNSKKVLFISHLAIGDFTYLQNGFRAFAQAFPHIEMHIWVDEVRRTANPEKWPHLKKYSLYDWLEASPLFAKVYRDTYSPALFEQSVTEAQMENYPIVISLATLRGYEYATLARRLGKGFAAGTQTKTNWFKLYRNLAYRKLDAVFPAHPMSKTNPEHITGIYAGWFEKLFGLQIPEAERFPYVDIPEEWTRRTREMLARREAGRETRPIVFINPYAKVNRRCWPLDRVAELIRAMGATEKWRNAMFVINAMPEDFSAANAVIGKEGLRDTFLFSADQNFFQLPAMLAESDLIISVETAVMHLANAVHIPVIALMRKKNPEWAPFDSANSIVVTTSRRSEWVSAITVEQVMKCVTLS